MKLTYEKHTKIDYNTKEKEYKYGNVEPKKPNYSIGINPIETFITYKDLIDSERDLSFLPNTLFNDPFKQIDPNTYYSDLIRRTDSILNNVGDSFLKYTLSKSNNVRNTESTVESVDYSKYYVTNFLSYNNPTITRSINGLFGNNIFFNESSLDNGDFNNVMNLEFSNENNVKKDIFKVQSGDNTYNVNLTKTEITSNLVKLEDDKPLLIEDFSKQNITFDGLPLYRNDSLIDGVYFSFKPNSNTHITNDFSINFPIYIGGKNKSDILDKIKDSITISLIKEKTMNNDKILELECVDSFDSNKVRKEILYMNDTNIIICKLVFPDNNFTPDIKEVIISYDEKIIFE